MTRSILTALAAVVAVGVLSGTGCKATGVGDPCTPEQEYDKSFLGFSVLEVNVESKSFQCQTRLCLVNHFQGRVSCPYGQDQAGNGLPGQAGVNVQGCLTPGINVAVDGKGPDNNYVDPKLQAQVKPQCTDRDATHAVYCSCRCANVDGRADDGAPYCQCPDGYTCEQLVTSIGPNDSGLTGAYCIKNSTKYDPNNACSDECDPVRANCGTVPTK